MTEVPDESSVAPEPARPWTLDQDNEAAALFPVQNPNPVLRFSRNGKCTFANRAGEDLLGCWGVSDDGLLPEQWRRVIENALDSGQSSQQAIPCRDRVFGVDFVPIAGADYVNVYARDITAQRAEREILNTIMEHTQAQLAYLDAQFNFVTVNSAYAAGCGFSRQDLIGRNHFDLFPDPENRVLFERARDSCQTLEYQARPFEFSNQPERGITYWDWTLTPVRRENGPVRGLVLSLVDVTERVRAEQLSNALTGIHTAISSKLDLAEIMQTVLVRSVEALHCDTGSIALREDGAWATRYGVGLPESALQIVLSDAEAPLLAQVARARSAIAVSDAEQQHEFSRDLVARHLVRAVLALPLIVQDTVIGILSFNYARPRTGFSQAEMDFARKLALTVSLALENARLVSQLEQRVQERTAELQAIFDSLPDAVYVGNEQGITRCNQAALDILGCSSIDELRDLIPNLAQKLQNRFAETGARVPTEQEPFVRALAGEGAVLEMIQRNLKTGTDVIVRSACAPFLRDGQVIGAVAVNTDITQRRQMEEELRRSQRLYQTLQDAIPDLVWSADGNGIADYVNRRWRDYTGLTLDDLNRVGWQAVNHPEDAERLSELWTQAAAQCRPMEAEFRYRRQDGTYRWFWGRSTPLADETGRIIKWVGVMTDIEDRRQAEQVLRAHDEELHAFSRRMVDVIENERRAISRELHDEAGQALTSLMVGIGLLQRDQDCPHSFYLRLEELKQTTDGVLDSLRKLAMELRPGALDKAGLVPAMQQYARSFGEQTGLEVEFVSLGFDDRDLPSALATNLYRMAQEALTNVARHAHASRVGIVLQKHGARVSLVVEDNGTGFDLAAAQQKGHLGLVGMRERAEMMCGNLYNETEPGRGTTLYVDVPAAASRAGD